MIQKAVGFKENNKKLITFELLILNESICEICIEPYIFTESG